MPKYQANRNSEGVKVSPKAIDVTGRRFGRLVALHMVPRTAKGKGIPTYWLCQCDCGGTKQVRCHDLLRSDTASCGCLRSDTYQDMIKHGMSYAQREYTVWKNIRTRCNNQNSPGYKHYGARGIKMCKRWQDSFDAFLRDMGPRPKGHSIDRIDVNGNYEPTNCRWADATTQTRNRRKMGRIEQFTTLEILKELQRRGFIIPMNPLDGTLDRLFLEVLLGG